VQPRVSVELGVIGDVNRKTIRKFGDPRVDEVINMEGYSAVRDGFVPIFTS